MGKYIMRLDDACERRDIEKWDRIEHLLDQFKIKPLVGVIPHCEDPEMEKYPIDAMFWKKCAEWTQKGWCIAMHGYNHVYSTKSGGVNPVHLRSEFAGESFEVQQGKIQKGVSLMQKHALDPKVFFAPSHTFDNNTLKALTIASNIRIISDTIASKPYYQNGFTFVPQQCGRVRSLPFAITTFCYHPNDMSEESFLILEKFLNKNHKHFVAFPLLCAINRKRLLDKLISKVYFAKRLICR